MKTLEEIAQILMEAEWDYRGYEGNRPIFKDRRDPERGKWLRMAKVVREMVIHDPVKRQLTEATKLLRELEKQQIIKTK